MAELENTNNPQTGSKKAGLPGFLLMIVLAVGGVFAAQWLPGSLDLTAENRFSISQPTQQVLANLPAPVQVTVLLQGEKLPAGFKKLQKTTADFLANCKNISGNQLQYQFVSSETFVNDSLAFPLNDTAKREWLKANAVMQNQAEKGGTRASFTYPLALVEANGNFETINLLKGQGNKGFLNPNATQLQAEIINSAEAQLEYNFVAAIQKLLQPVPPIVAYAMGNGQPDGPETYDLRQTLSNQYRFYLLNLQQQPFISDSIKVLMLVKPTQAFSDADKLKIDQYLLRGGRVLFLLDALHAGMDSLISSGKDFTAFSRNLGLDDLLFRYGVRVNHDLVTDKQSDVLPQNVGSLGGQPQIEMLPWPYFPLLYSNSNHPVAKNLDAVVMQFPNSIDTVQAEGIKKEVLLTTSNTSRITGAPAIITVEILKQMEAAAAYKQKEIPLAVLLEGKFKSLYANRLSSAITDSLQAAQRPFLPVGQENGKILITGDGDWVLNGMGRKGPLTMGENPYTQYQFANKDFLLNAIEWLTDETGIMASRSKQFTLRLLDPKRLEDEKTGWQWLNIGLPLLLVLLAGLVFNWRRQKRFAR